jgi:hypothetical protein
MSDQIIDAAAAQGLYAYAHRTCPKVSWTIMRDQAEYPGEFVARLVMNAPTPYVLLADTLPGLQAQLPIGLVRSERRPSDLLEVVEVWSTDETRISGHAMVQL